MGEERSSGPDERVPGTGFEGDIVVKPVQPEGTRWELVEPFTYHAKTDSFTIPAGFITDFASVPRLVVWLLPRYGQWTAAAILHDYLWALSRKGEFEKSDADGIFNRSMRELGVPFLRRWIMWTAVRWASGPRSWFDKGLSDIWRMVLIAIPALAVITIPALTVLVALVVGAVAEFVVYLPLRFLARDSSKDVNAPEVRDVALTA